MTKEHDDEIDQPKACMHCHEIVRLEFKRPPDFLCFKDILNIILIAFGLTVLLGFYWLKFIIILTLIIPIYLLAKNDQYCPECLKKHEEPVNLYYQATGIMLLQYFFVNLIITVISAFLLDGDAFYGSVQNGRYYVGYGSQNMNQEVSRVVYELSLCNIQLHFLFGVTLLIVVILALSKKSQ